ncbi:NAD(P)-dependent dehydrogenase (short-subunit alcohol dehydrogenase family) [Amycolatopsis echigonensis]|uniref:NAD(P)-dependent dehydrogenase (Short-subunit alcohol dehydrogenase family) n=1 Tax=Amycolatopsis echigonensis TaxID=2576905 RepID=A0A2N3WIY0_9PSEU|nr:SDR family oxidoreductase [Amycolatopsis niigatensis]PKV93818.1 NAD(P)-dependent dehydrogenase (short-subunit alcohol dehydrogenase family) [Amycolatopsis niigatensis]
MSLVDQRVVVIGGSSGMGLATAWAAAAAGASVTIASSGKERLDAALAELPDTCEGFVTDVRDDANVAALFEHVGELDHLVYTAGDALDQRPLAELPLDVARSLFDVRFWGVVAAAKHAAPRIRPGGSIVLTSGIIGVRPTPGAALAASSVGAIEGLARGLAVDLAPVRVNTVRPGPVHTPMWDGLPQPQLDAMVAAFTERTLTKAIGEADQVAATNLYLMENRFVTGAVITVDGGFVLTGS